MNKFKFGDRVHVAYPHWSNANDVGVVIGSNGGLNNVQFENGGYSGLVPDEFLTLATNWVKFNINDESTYPPANDSRLIRFNNWTCGTVYVTNDNDNNSLGSGVGKKWAFYSDAGYANLENITHHHPLPTPPQD